MRKKAEAEKLAKPSSENDTSTSPQKRCSQAWAMLIKRVYESDPLSCARCGGQMNVIAFIDPPQGDVIEKILCGHRRAAMVGGLWQASAPRAPPDVDGLVHELDSDCSDQTPELTYVDIDTFLATF